MISRNKFLSFLIGCMIANSCFGVVVCHEGYYVAYCGNMELSFDNIMTNLKAAHSIKFDDDCWAVDGSLTTAQHYQNISAIFGWLDCNTLGLEPDCNDIGVKINRMDGGEDAGSATHCINIPNGKQNAYWLKKWGEAVRDTCMEAATSDSITSSVVCQKCPNDGYTVAPTEYTGIGAAAQWKTFNTIADCYTKTGSDTKGTFTVKVIESTGIPVTVKDDKCYYSY